MNLARNPFVRLMRARPRLFIAAAVAVSCWLILPAEVSSEPVTRALIAWNVGTLLYVVLATVMMARSSDNRIRQRARLQDEGQVVILVLVIVAALASLAAIAGQLTLAKAMHGAPRMAHIALAGITVVSSWAFIQVMFCLHYAHQYYAAAATGTAAGLQFPGEDRPTYGDFFYFAAVIGTSGQTADVAFVSRSLRRIGTAHCILAYLFNTTVLALLINIGSSLI